MVVEIQHKNSATIYEGGAPLYHATIGDVIHYKDGKEKKLLKMEDISSWLKELYFSDCNWEYDGHRNWTQK